MPVILERSEGSRGCGANDIINGSINEIIFRLHNGK